MDREQAIAQAQFWANALHMDCYAVHRWPIATGEWYVVGSDGPPPGYIDWVRVSPQY